MRKIVCLLLVLLLTLSVFGTALAANEITITIDGKPVEFSDEYGYPYIDENNRTQVPVRIVMEQYGCKVEWNGAERTAVISKDGTTVLVPIGEKHIVVNGKTVEIDTAAVIKGDRTYLPIRAVLEAFGAIVDWNDGDVIITSPATSSAIENIYIDDDGNLIFERANGNKVNIGSVSEGKDGKDGRDGVSVTNAVVNASGNLIITLSNGHEINAGNVTSGGGLDFLTFEDYPVGTKFYLTKPSGEFDVPFVYNNKTYTIHFSNMYYELTEKHDIDESWSVNNGNTLYRPYTVTFHIDGYTSSELAGEINVSFKLGYDNFIFHCSGIVDSEGYFLITFDKDTWVAPQPMFFGQVSISPGSTPTNPDTLTQEEIVALIAGEWSASPTDKVVVNTDGKLIFNGEEYSPEYSYNANYADIDVGQTPAVTTGVNGKPMYFFPALKMMFYYGQGALIPSKVYYKDRTWTEITLTKDNFFDYYEITERLEIAYDAFGDFTSAKVNYILAPKEGYYGKIDRQISDMAVKLNRTYYDVDYSIDLENETYTFSGSGMGEWGNIVTYTNVFDESHLDTSYLNSDTGGGCLAFSYQIEKAQGTLYLINE